VLTVLAGPVPVAAVASMLMAAESKPTPQAKLAAAMVKAHQPIPTRAPSRLIVPSRTNRRGVSSSPRAFSSNSITRNARVQYSFGVVAESDNRDGSQSMRHPQTTMAEYLEIIVHFLHVQFSHEKHIFGSSISDALTVFQEQPEDIVSNTLFSLAYCICGIIQLPLPVCVPPSSWSTRRRSGIIVVLMTRHWESSNQRMCSEQKWAFC
jgi:hypothetical protein